MLEQLTTILQKRYPDCIININYRYNFALEEYITVHVASHDNSKSIIYWKMTVYNNQMYYRTKLEPFGILDITNNDPEYLNIINEILTNDIKDA